MTPRGALAHARLVTFFPDCVPFVYELSHWRMAPMDLSGRYRQHGIMPPENCNLVIGYCPELVDEDSAALNDEEFVEYCQYWERRLRLRIDALLAGEDMIDTETAIDAAFAAEGYPLSSPIRAILETP